MSDNLKKCLKQLVSKIKDKRTRRLLSQEMSKNDCIFKAIKEIFDNAIRSNILLSSYTKKKGREHEKTIKEFMKQKLSKPRNVNWLLRGVDFYRIYYLLCLE